MGAIMTPNLFRKKVLYSSMPSDAYMRQWTKQSLVQITVCSLLYAKPLSESNSGVLLTGPLGKNRDIWTKNIIVWIC